MGGGGDGLLGVISTFLIFLLYFWLFFNFYFLNLLSYYFFRGSWHTFFLVNRVEHQKLNQTTPYGAVWLSFWCSTRPSADSGN